MAIQESTRQDSFPAGGDSGGGSGAARDERIEAGGAHADAAAQSWDDVDAAEEMELEEILLPESVRDGFAQVGEAVRNLVRIHPLSALLATAGAAYLAGRLASRR
jgi:hypothetical protein